MARDISIACRCGAVRGMIASVRGAVGPRMICMCDDCQAFAHFLGNADEILDANGGSDVVPVRPAHLCITQGIENIACMRLGPRGMFRWYARCCRTPIANTMPSWKIPYASVFRLAIRDGEGEGDAGPLRARVQAKFGIGSVPADAHQTASLGVILSVAMFLLPGMIMRQHRPSPFFDADGRPVIEPEVLSLDERNRLRRRCGPNPEPPAQG